MNVPTDLQYSSDHEWVRAEDDVVRIGITDYAQDALGDVVYIELPAVGDRMESGASFGEVESTKSVSDLFAPIAGVVAAVNDALTDNPELINTDPYGDGWVCTITPDDNGALAALLDAAAYQDLIGSA